MRVPYARIHEEPRREAHVIGAFSRGDVARAVECVPSCDYRRGFLRVEPFGFVRMTDVERGEQPVLEAELAHDAPRRFARTAALGTATLAAAEDDARVVARHRVGDQLALVGDPRLDVPGFFRRAGGGWVSARHVRPNTPSTLEGERSPTLPLAFVVEATTFTDEGGGTRPAPRYARFSVHRETDAVISGDVGSVPRESVRVARRTPRPPRVPARARWVHVDLDEQTLVAYEGDTPVFATLVSSGMYPHATRTGLFRVYQKTRSMAMNGAEERARYRVEAVSNVMFFHNDLALHTAYWHDRFGTAVSHGCVNLSPADAVRLFDWAPPEMPEGFRTVFPERLELARLYVLLTR